MKKELKDYLPFYLGAKCLLKSDFGRRVIEGIVTINTLYEFQFYDGHEKSLQLILYSLTDINKTYHFRHSNNTVIPLEYISTSKADSQQMMKRIENEQNIDVFEFWKIQRLLELQFDVFDLIKEGFAVNAAEL